MSLPRVDALAVLATDTDQGTARDVAIGQLLELDGDFSLRRGGAVSIRGAAGVGERLCFPRQ